MSDITFLCPSELDGKIPKPERAAKFLPDWFRNLPREMGMPDAHGLPGLTVRACLPVADIMSLGWIIPLPYDIRVVQDMSTGQLQFQWPDDGPFQPIEGHHPDQIGADKSPFFGRSPLKFINPWRVDLPKGWSASFIHPVNHFELPFLAFNGSVDCDALDVPVNVPFLWNAQAPEIYLPAGAPMVQVIPYERRAMPNKATIRAETKEEAQVRSEALTRKYTEESVYSKEWRRRHERES